MRQNIGLIGKFGSGKDTAAHALMTNFGYGKVSFAGPLKAMVADADPLVGCGDQQDRQNLCAQPLHLSDVLLGGMSFEDAKRTYPEVRRALQRIGQGVRKYDPDYWVRLALKDVEYLNDLSCAVVITDVRYVNEAEALRDRGFKLIRVTRKPDPRGYTTAETALMMHDSETDLDYWPADATIANDGTIEQLYDALSALVN
jgi:dephospho-CoA kinase